MEKEQWKANTAKEAPLEEKTKNIWDRYAGFLTTICFSCGVPLFVQGEGLGSSPGGGGEFLASIVVDNAPGWLEWVQR